MGDGGSPPGCGSVAVCASVWAVRWCACVVRACGVWYVQSEPFMRPFQNRSLVVALHESKRTASDLTVRVRQLEAEREQLRQTVSCVRRHWSQVRPWVRPWVSPHPTV